MPILLNSGPSKRGFHRLGLALQCPQKYAWTYLDPHAVSDMTPPLARGILIHVALAHHYARLRAYQQGEDMAAYYSADEAMRLVCEHDPRLQPHLALCAEAYVAYLAAYQPEVEVNEFEILMVEDVIEATVQGRYLVTGRLDLAVRDRAGRIFVIDHKSTSRITKAHRVFYSLHGQLWLYLYLARQKYGSNLAGFRVNLVQHGASGTTKFERFDLPRSRRVEQLIEQYVLDAEAVIEQNQHRPFDQWPSALNELTCFTRYGVCPFADKCLNGKGARITMDIDDWEVREDAPKSKRTRARKT
jgi:hypothetical protein